MLDLGGVGTLHGGFAHGQRPWASLHADSQRRLKRRKARISRNEVLVVEIFKMIWESPQRTALVRRLGRPPVGGPSAEMCEATNSLELVLVDVDVGLLNFSHPEVECKSLDATTHIGNGRRKDRPNEHDLYHKKDVETV